MMLNSLAHVFNVLSPTYAFADYRKRVADQEGGAQKRADRIIAYNHRYLFVSIIFFLVMGITNKWHSYPYSELKWLYYSLLGFYIWVLPLSRCNEIFFAFISDALDKFNLCNKSKSTLTYHQRLKLAFLSYLELVINFATIYWVLPASFWKNEPPFKNVIDALYFSGVTITTVGYGDYSPINWFPKILTVYEVFCGVILLVVCFTVYTSLGLSDSERQNHQDSTKPISSKPAVGQPKKLNNRRFMTNQRLLTSILLLVVGIWIANLCYCSGWETSERGTFGDLFGASNSLFSGLAFVGVALALYLQSKQNKIGSIQQFESTFFLMLSLHQQILQDIDIHLKSKKILRGRRCFRFLYKEYIREFEKVFKHTSSDELGLISETYFDFYEKRQDKLAHYFQTLYNIIKYVNEADPEIDKIKYINLVRAQLSVYELGLLFYNCLAELGRDKFKPLIEEYRLFKNMPKSILYSEHHTQLYSESAFKGAPAWTSTRKFESDEEEMSYYFEEASLDQENDEK